VLIGRVPYEGLEIKTTRLIQCQSQRNTVTEGLVALANMATLRNFEVIKT